MMPAASSSTNAYTEAQLLARQERGMKTHGTDTPKIRHILAGYENAGGPKTDPCNEIKKIAEQISSDQIANQKEILSVLHNSRRFKELPPDVKREIRRAESHLAPSRWSSFVNWVKGGLSDVGNWIRYSQCRITNDHKTSAMNTILTEKKQLATATTGPQRRQIREQAAENLTGLRNRASEELQGTSRIRFLKRWELGNYVGYLQNQINTIHRKEQGEPLPPPPPHHEEPSRVQPPTHVEPTDLTPQVQNILHGLQGILNNLATRNLFDHDRTRFTDEITGLMAEARITNRSPIEQGTWIGNTNKRIPKLKEDINLAEARKAAFDAALLEILRAFGAGGGGHRSVEEILNDLITGGHLTGEQVETMIRPGEGKIDNIQAIRGYVQDQAAGRTPKERANLAIRLIAAEKGKDYTQIDNAVQSARERFRLGFEQSKHPVANMVAQCLLLNHMINADRDHGALRPVTQATINEMRAEGGLFAQVEGLKTGDIKNALIELLGRNLPQQQAPKR